MWTERWNLPSLHNHLPPSDVYYTYMHACALAATSSKKKGTAPITVLAYTFQWLTAPWFWIYSVNIWYYNILLYTRNVSVQHRVFPRGLSTEGSFDLSAICTKKLCVTTHTLFFPLHMCILQGYIQDFSPEHAYTHARLAIGSLGMLLDMSRLQRCYSKTWYVHSLCKHELSSSRC